jgi:hypothetical protein
VARNRSPAAAVCTRTRPYWRCPELPVITTLPSLPLISQRKFVPGERPPCQWIGVLPVGENAVTATKQHLSLSHRPPEGRHGQPARTRNSGQDGCPRELILDVATRLFSEKGYVGTTMRDIATAVGVLPASLYTSRLAA